MAVVAMNKRKKPQLFDVVNFLLVTVIILLILYPLYFCVVASFSEPKEVAAGNVVLWVRGFTLKNYEYVFQEKQLWIGYRNSIIYTFFSVLYDMGLTIPAAYVLSKKHLPFRGFISWYFFITMYISGGMIPTYFLIQNLGLMNNPLVMIVGAGVSCYNLILTRQYFSTNIPTELYEAGYMDGAGEGHMFFSIALPLAKPILAVIALYCAVSSWNGYMKALLYIRDLNLRPLQLVLRNLLIENNIAVEIDTADYGELVKLLEKAEIVQGMKYAIVFVAAAPLLIAYPFIQKYFTQGITLGSVKG